MLKWGDGGIKVSGGGSKVFGGGIKVHRHQPLRLVNRVHLVRHLEDPKCPKVVNHTIIMSSN